MFRHFVLIWSTLAGSQELAAWDLSQGETGKYFKYIINELTKEKCYFRPPHHMGVFLLTKTQMLCHRPLQVSYLSSNCHQQTLRPFFQDLVSPLV